MATRKNKGQSDGFVQLPFMQSTILYARVEKPQGEQPDPVETLRTSALELGCNVEQITVYTDVGERATAPLLEREGYTGLLQALSRRVSGVFLHPQGDMFNGADEYQVTFFIHRCMMKAVIIVTPSEMFDMSNLAHIVRFRAAFLSEFEKVTWAITRQ